MITLNQIIAQLESFSRLHAQVNSFGHGNTSQYKEENSLINTNIKCVSSGVQ